VSDSESIAVTTPSARGLAQTLIAGGLCAAAALMMQTMNFNLRHDAVPHRPSLVRMIISPATLQPSAYDEESGMSPAQLLGRWDGLIAEASQRFNVPKTWIRAVMARESGGRTMLGEDQPIVSRAGAVGLMQLLPETFGEMAAEHRLGDNPFDARANIMAGTAYLRWLHHKYGYPAMFAAYNAGPGRLEDHLAHGSTLPAETRAYVGGIASTLKLQTGKSGLELVKLTRPDGAVVKIDPGQVTAVRAATPGEFAPGVNSVLTLNKRKQQGIREDVQIATAAIRAAGKLI
jgi:hypothetical protein